MQKNIQFLIENLSYLELLAALAFLLLGLTYAWFRWYRYRRSLLAGQKERDRLLKDLRNLSDKQRSLVSKFANLHKVRSSTWKSRFSEHGETLADKQEQIENLNLEIENLRGNPQEAVLSNDEEILRLRKELDTRDQDLESLRFEIQNVRTTAPENDELKIRIRELEEQLKNKSGEVQQVSQPEAPETSRLQQIISNLETNIQDKDVELNRLSSSEQENYEVEIERLNRLLVEKDAESARALENNSSLSSKNAQLGENATRYQQEITSLRLRLDQLQNAEPDTASSENTEMLQLKLAESEKRRTQEVESLKIKLDRMDQDMGTLDTLRNDLEAKELEITRLNEKLAAFTELQHELQEQRESNQRLVREHDDIALSQRVEIDRLAALVGGTGEQEEHLEENNRLKDLIAARDETIARLRHDHSLDRQKLEINEKELAETAQTTQPKKEFDALSARLEEVEKQFHSEQILLSSERDARIRDIENRDNTIAELTQQLETSVSAKEDKILELEARISETAPSDDDSRTSLLERELAEEREDHQNKILRLEDRIANLASAPAPNPENTTVLEQRIALLEQQLSEKNKQIETLQVAPVETASTEFSILAEKLSGIAAELSATGDQLKNTGRIPLPSAAQLQQLKQKTTKAPTVPDVKPPKPKQQKFAKLGDPRGIFSWLSETPKRRTSLIELPSLDKKTQHAFNKHNITWDSVASWSAEDAKHWAGKLELGDRIEEERWIYKAQKEYEATHGASRDTRLMRRNKCPRRIIFNNDGHESPATPATQESFLAHRLGDLERSQVDTISYCTGIWDLFTHKTDVGHQLGVDIELDGKEWVTDLDGDHTNSLNETISWGNQHGREIFFSFRMNDSFDSCSPDLLSPWKNKHRDLLMGQFGEFMPWGANRWSSVDYRHEEVRDHVFNVLEEVCLNYDVDGIELDFFRHPLFFKEQTEGREISQKLKDDFTDLMRRIRCMTDKISRDRKRSLLIAIRVPDSIGFCNAIGIDLETWLKEDFADIIIGGGYFQLQPWDDLAVLGRRFQLPAYACLSGSRLTSAHEPHRPVDQEIWRGEALRAWNSGVHGIYTFNQFETSSPIWNELGDPALLRELPRSKEKIWMAEGSWSSPCYWVKDGYRYEVR